MWRVEKIIWGKSAVLRLSGRIQGDELKELEEAIASERRNGSVALDLSDVRLVDQETVSFLAVQEAGGIKLLNCPSYIREWMKGDEQVP